jgi:DNA-directed RNA polymerase subunit RPC12/RpoP
MAFKKFEDKPREGRGFERQMFDVSGMNIKCCDCGTPITQLPFNPDPNRLDSIRCQECLRRFREQRRRF